LFGDLFIDVCDFGDLVIFFCVIIIFEVDVGMVMIMVHDRCSVFDGSEVSSGFNEELNLCLGAFGYVSICV
jgi:hypothetical protein